MKKAKFRLSVYKNYKFVWIPYFLKQELLWKDKYDDPRCEKEPHFRFEWLWWGIYGVWGDEQYWEQWLWINKYYNGDYEKAKETWEWIDSETKQSTWIEY